MNRIIKNNDFFNDLAEDYDLMISFTKAIKGKKNALKNIITADMRYAADIGCGTGTDSIALSSLGLKVTAFDPSSEMIKVAENNAKSDGLSINFQNYPIDSIPKSFNNKFHFAISLGNTFANIEKEKFQHSIHRCFDILKTNGVLLIQILNYEKVIEEKKRIINITQGNNKYFIRLYDFLKEEIIFNILTFSKKNPAEHKIISTRLSPYTQSDFSNGLEEAGFSTIRFFSDFNLSIFNTKQSKDLIIKAVKS